MKKTGLYIHIPFCVKKCAYCDFTSYEGQDDETKERYIDAVIREMRLYYGESVDTIYLGGGTPTSLKSHLIDKLLFAVRESFHIESGAEITVECNPGTADEKYFKELLNSGVNRLSIGVQSLCDDELKMLGRIHSAQDAKIALSSAKSAGFSNISADVMFGLPNQSEESLIKTFEGICALKPWHISCYSLTIEPGTPFERAGVSALDEDSERDMYALITKRLAAFGYAKYEISNFAAMGKVSRHNVKYWECAPYIGLGVAAHSYFGGVRYENTENLTEYISAPEIKKNCTEISKEDKMTEYMILGLRMTNGVSLKEFSDDFDTDILLKYNLEKFLKAGLLNIEGGRLFLSEAGIDISNTVFEAFI